jgi:hypothetical protein
MLNALRFASRASNVKVAAKVMRFTDFEGMYNEAQRALDAAEEKDREKALGWARVAARVETQEGELERLRDEVRTLKSQGAMQLRGMGGGVCSQCGMGGMGGVGGVPGVKSATGSSTAEAAKSADHHKQLQALSEQHLQDLAAVRRELEGRVSAQKKLTVDAEQEAASLQYDLQSERTRHLASLEDVKKYHQRSVEVESRMGVRVSELLAELAEKNALLDELRPDANGPGAGKGGKGAKGCVKLGSAAAAEVHLGPNGEELVSRGQLLEMESLFLDTVNRLSSRVIDLEKSQRQQQQQQQSQQQLQQSQQSQGAGRARGGSAVTPSPSSGGLTALNSGTEDRLPPIPRGSFGLTSAGAGSSNQGGGGLAGLGSGSGKGKPGSSGSGNGSSGSGSGSGSGAYTYSGVINSVNASYLGINRGTPASAVSASAAAFAASSGGNSSATGIAGGARQPVPPPSNAARRW